MHFSPLFLKLTLRALKCMRLIEMSSEKARPFHGVIPLKLGLVS